MVVLGEWGEEEEEKEAVSADPHLFLHLLGRRLFAQQQLCPQQLNTDATCCCCCCSATAAALLPFSVDAGAELLQARNSHQRVIRLAAKDTPKNRNRPDLTPWMRLVAATRTGSNVHLNTRYERSTFGARLLLLLQSRSNWDGDKVSVDPGALQSAGTQQQRQGYQCSVVNATHGYRQLNASSIPWVFCIAKKCTLVTIL